MNPRPSGLYRSGGRLLHTIQHLNFEVNLSICVHIEMYISQVTRINRRLYLPTARVPFIMSPEHCSFIAHIEPAAAGMHDDSCHPRCVLRGWSWNWCSLKTNFTLLSDLIDKPWKSACSRHLKCCLSRPKI